MTQNQYFENSGFDEPIVPIPALMRATLILIALNVLIVLWFYFSPGTSIASPAKPEAPAQQVLTAAKPSPFEAVVAEPRRKGVRTPPKAAPYFAEVVSPSTSSSIGN